MIEIKKQYNTSPVGHYLDEWEITFELNVQLSVWIGARFFFEKKGGGMEIKDLIGAAVEHKMFGQAL